MNTFGRPLWALALVTLGAALLLQALGLVPTSVWGALLELWPVLLIAVGLRMWLGPRSAWGRALPAAIVAASLVWTAFNLQVQSPGPLHPLVQYTGGVESASVSLRLTTVRLNLSALDSDVLLMEGGVLTAPGETIGQRFIITDRVGQLSLTQELDRLFAPFLAAPDLAPRWDVRLTPFLPLALDVHAANGVLTLDLASTKLTALTLQTNAADAAVIFPARGLVADVRSTAGDLRLTLPAGIPARLTLTTPPDRLRIPPFLIQDGQVFTSPGFSPAGGTFLDLHVVSATGLVTVD